MRRAILSLLLLGLAAGLARADEWNKDFAVTGRPELHINAKDGNVTVSSWDKNQINVHVITQGYRIAQNEVRVEDRQSGDRVDIDLLVPTHTCFICMHINWSIRVEVRVPRQSDLDLRTGDGNIQGEQVHGSLHIKTGDGNVELRDVEGNLSADSGDGNLRLQGRFDALDVHTGDGNVVAEVADGSKMTGSWSVRTGDGNVEMRLPENFSAELSLRTGDGRITFDMPVEVSGSLSRSYVHGKLNSGGATLDVHTGDGSIHLGR